MLKLLDVMEGSFNVLVSLPQSFVGTNQDLAVTCFLGA